MAWDGATSWKGKFRLDMVIALIIFIIPFFAYWHLYFSDVTSEFKIFGNNYPHIFASNRTFIWYFFRNSIPVVLLVIWFFTTSRNWKYLLLPMIIVYVKSILTYFPDIPTQAVDVKLLDFYNRNFIDLLVITLFIGLILLFDNFLFKAFRKQVLEISFDSIFFDNLKNKTKTYQLFIDKIRSNKNRYSSINYLYRIVNIKLLVELWLSKNFIFKIRNTSNQKITKNDFLAILMFCLVLLLWYSHHLIPEHLEEFTLGFISIDSNGFDNIRTYIWFLTRKLIVIIPMLTWYIICTSWWRFAILSPLVIYSYQLWEATQDVQYLDAAGNIKSFPIIVLVVIILIMVSKIIKYRVDLLVLYETLVKEIDVIIEDGEFNANKAFQRNLLQIKQLRKEIAGESNQNTKLIRLISLRDQLLEGRYGVD